MQMPNPMRRFLLAISALTGPGAIGAILSLITTPFLVIWFSPSQFGEVAFTLAIASILAGLVTLRLEVLLYRNEIQISRIEFSQHIMVLVIIISTILAVPFFGFFLIKKSIFGLDIFNVLMIWTATVALSFCNIGAAYQVSQRSYIKSGLPKIISPIIVLFSAMVSVWIGYRSVHVLALSNLFGLIASAILFCWDPIKRFQVFNVKKSISIARKEIGYSIFAVPQAILSAASFLNLYLMISAQLFGHSFAGQLFLAFRMVGFPSTVIGVAASNLLASYADEIRQNGLRQYWLGMAAIGTVIYFPILTAIPLIPLEIIPTEWRSSLSVLLPITVLCFAQFLFGSFAQLLLVWGDSAKLLIWDCSRLILTCGIALLSYFLDGSAQITTWIFVSIHIASYAALGILVWRARKNTDIIVK